MKKALIIGITGQDGSYLAERLLAQGYEVHGTVRRVALEDPAHRLLRINHILDEITLHSASLESFPSLYAVFQTVKPDECYHLGAQSFVSYSFDDEFSTMNINVNGTHYILSSLHNVWPECRFYFAGTSEMFGKVEETPQTETTRFHPRSVYGISKVAGFDLTRNYRESYDLFACSGILFNHESPRRGFEFVSRKITFAAAQIKLGLSDKISLGNIEAKRDWGHARDYVKAMHLMLTAEHPDDYIIASGEAHSVKEFLEISFGLLDLNYEDYLVIDPRFYRPAEVDILQGDSSKARADLGWSSETSFEELVTEMVQSDYDLLKSH
jgi:GDPmannose 4,6-dehydratase